MTELQIQILTLAIMAACIVIGILGLTSGDRYGRGKCG